MPRYRALCNTYISNRYLRPGDIFVTARPIPDSPGVIEELDQHNRPVKPAPVVPPTPENPVLSVTPAPEPRPPEPVLDTVPPPEVVPGISSGPIDFLS